MASENGFDSGCWNVLEIASCGIGLIGCIYLLRWYCVRRRAKKLQKMREALQSVQVQPNIAPLPVLQPPVAESAPQLSAYPGLPQKTSAELMGEKIMAQYTQ